MAPVQGKFTMPWFCFGDGIDPKTDPSSALPCPFPLCPVTHFADTSGTVGRGRGVFPAPGTGLVRRVPTGLSHFPGTAQGLVSERNSLFSPRLFVMLLVMICPGVGLPVP